MMRIVKTEDRLGENVWKCLDECNEMGFFVNSNPGKELNYSAATGLVRCPYGCRMSFALTVLLENYEQEQRLDHFIGNVHKAWSPDGVKEEQL